MTKLTKVQLIEQNKRVLARINELEAELGMRDKTLAQMQREHDATVAAYIVEQRPSRRQVGDRASTDFQPTMVARPFRERLDEALHLSKMTGRSIPVAKH